MTISYKCKSCGASLKIKDELAGRKGKCPKCKTAFRIPQPKKAAAAHAKPSSGGSVDPPKDEAAPSGTEAARENPQEEFDPERFLFEDFDDGGGSDPLGGTAAGGSPFDATFPSPDLGGDDWNPDGSEETTAATARRDEDENRKEEQRRVEAEAARRRAAEVADAVLRASGTKISSKELQRAKVEEEDKARQRELAYLRYVAIRVAIALVVAAVLGYGAYRMAGWLFVGGSDLPPMGTVSGVVTLDGKPLANATVTFVPVEPAIPKNKPQSIGQRRKPKLTVPAAWGVTDDQGRYQLRCFRNQLGAVLGKYKVQISKRQDGKETVPKQFNTQSSLMAEVKEGDNEIPFHLTSKGTLAD
ncbi:MAG: hypothetical protein D6725_15815 [Planctomycetota bacterium]|nr:MAG: hypothetical protein D6725_15815 [Planctomycetota bacterium]